MRKNTTPPPPVSVSVSLSFRFTTFPPLIDRADHGDAFVWGAGARTLLDVDQTYAAIAPTRIQRPVGTHLVDIAMCDDHAFMCAQSTWS